MEASGSASNELDSFLSQSFLDLEKIAENLYRSKTLWKFPEARGIYGGQLIGHSLVAASRSIAEDQHIHSLHSYFVRPGQSDIPILYHVDKTREGRTYCTCSVKATQKGQAVFTMQASFKQEESYKPNFQKTMPNMPHPDELKSPAEVFELLNVKHLITKKQAAEGLQYFETFPILMKWVDPAEFLYYQYRPPKRYVWMKARGHIGDDMNQNTHKCCLAYMTDLFLLQTAFLPMAPVRFSDYLQASLDHSMWFHGPCRADEWMLFGIETDHTGDGRSFCRGNIWNSNGDLVVSVAQEGVIRLRNQPSKL